MSLKNTVADVNIGQKVQKRRKVLGITAEELGKKIGVSQHQIYKYESGQDRISASIIKEISLALGVPVEYFFNAHNYNINYLSDETITSEECPRYPLHFPIKLLDDPDTLKLVKAYISINEFRVRKALLENVISVAAMIKNRKK